MNDSEGTLIGSVASGHTSRPPHRGRTGQARSSQVFGVLVALAIVVIFSAALLLRDDRWTVPQWAVLLYGAASILCFLVYALDKAAARAGRWRAPERTLLGLGLIGGWPGGLLAQQMFRHKIRKPPFMRVFVGTVIANLVVLVLIATPLGGTALCSIVGCR